MRGAWGSENVQDLTQRFLETLWWRDTDLESLWKMEKTAPSISQMEEVKEWFSYRVDERTTKIRPLGTRVHHHLELGVERFLHGEFTYPSRSIHRDQRNNTQSMGDSQSHDTLVVKTVKTQSKSTTITWSHHSVNFLRSFGSGSALSFRYPPRTAVRIRARRR